MSDPFVSVLVLNRNGRAGLANCLPSLQEQDYRSDRFEILLVDDGSTDDSVAFVRERFAAVKVVPRRGHLGRGAALGSALPLARGDHLAFVDPDVRLHASWLQELVEAAALHSVAAVASTILDETGQSIECAGNIVSCVGHAWPRSAGASPAALGQDSPPLLFAPSAAMLVERGAYDAAGGYDPDYFAHGEDLDLGWRLSLLGYRTVLAPRSIAYRESKGLDAPRLLLRERNALFTIYKCYGEDLLDRVLPVAIALTVARALHHSELGYSQPGAQLPEATPVSPRTIETLMALEDFARNLERLREKRKTIQSRRRVPDEALLPLFVEPLKTHDLGPQYQSMATELYQELGLSSIASDLTERPADPPRKRGEEVAPAAFSESESTVSIVIPTLLGPTHLPECLASLRKLRYPNDKIEVIVVDNNAKEDPSETVRQHYPEAKVVHLPENRGFSGGIAAGAREARGEWLAFLNDDTRVDAEWVREMVDTANRRQAPCVAARILNWAGDRIDFAAGAVSFEGKGFQLGHGSRRIDSWAEERPLLFACGAAMMVRRELFLETGGFDEAMFAYYEDVAFGWQLNIRGYDVWLSPRALVYHKHQGTAGIWETPFRTRLYERNALRTVFTHLEPQNLRRVLPAALLLLNQRTLLAAGLSRRLDEGLSLLSLLRSSYRSRRRGGGFLSGIRSCLATMRRAVIPAPSRATISPPPQNLSPSAAAALLAFQDWLASLPEQRRRRREIQQHRRRSDAEILSAFSDRWTQPVGAEPRDVYHRVHEMVVQAFSLEDMVP